jgi:hypothetical protein
VMIFRRIMIVLVGAILAFVIELSLDYQVERHTRNGRLAKQVLLLGMETEMNDGQIARSIGDDPMRVLRRSVVVSYIVELATSLTLSLLVGCFERRTPAVMTSLALAPYIIWSGAAHVPINWRKLSPIGVAGTELGISVVFVALAAIVSVAVARFLSRHATAGGSGTYRTSTDTKSPSESPPGL